MKTYKTPKTAVLRKSMRVMDGYDLIGSVTDGRQFSNEQTFEQDALPKANSVWD